MVKDLVSVLIPCYNHEKYVKKTLESVYNNSYEKIEVVFIDDGSSDESFKVAKEYLERNKNRFYNIYIEKQNNIGVTKTLNKMLKKSSGEYIALLASDDYYTDKSIESRVEYLKKNNKSAVIGNSFLIDQEDRILSDNASKKLYRANKKILESEFINLELILRWSVVGPTLLLKREVYDIIGEYDENLKVEDRDFYLRLLRKELLGYLNEDVSYYRIHVDNVSRNIKTRKKILLEIADINIKYSKMEFRKIEKYYLKSYFWDKKLVESNSFKILFLYKLTRALLVEIYLLYLSIKMKKRKK